MAIYDVQVSRVVKLTFVNIEAATAEDAALLADARANGVTDCIVRGYEDAAPVGQRGHHAGALLCVRDSNINTEVLVNLVRDGVTQRDERFTKSQPMALKGALIGVAS
ncbi:MAG: hypothetical protein EPN64_13150 [Burkholderiaceae bacterium]|nr:MAG: hypothetical protein EPN64_13150 [Burkholderiaceae bacterium]